MSRYPASKSVIAPTTASDAAWPCAFAVQTRTLSGRISIKIAASMKPARRATRDFRTRSPQRCIPDFTSTRPPITFAPAANKPKRRIDVIVSGHYNTIHRLRRLGRGQVSRDLLCNLRMALQADRRRTLRGEYYIDSALRE